MSYNNSDVCHMWAHNKLNGKSEIKGSNLYADERNLKSYSTVIGQCLDRDKGLFLCIDESLTSSTSKHISYMNRALTGYARVIYTHFNGSRGFYYGYSYDNVNFLGYRETFDKKHRFALISHLLGVLYDHYECVKVGKTLDTENIDKQTITDIDMLNNIYGDCSLSKWLRGIKYSDTTYGYGRDKSRYLKIRKMVRMTIDGATDAEITDALFGAGTWDAMQKRIAPLKKGRETKERLERFIQHLGYRLDREWGSFKPSCPYTAKELRKLTPRQVVEIRFANMQYMEEYERLKEYREKRGYSPKEASFIRACRFVGVSNRDYSNNRKVIKPDGTVVYDTDMYDKFVKELEEYVFSNASSWDNTGVCFVSGGSDYLSFIAAPDKHLWRERFWQKCSLKQRRIHGAWLYNLRQKYEKHGKSVEFTEEENHIYNEFVVRLNHKEELAAKQRVIEEARMAKVMEERMQRIDAYRENGIDGLRRLWIEHLDNVPSDIMYSPQLCYGGNVLLRFSKQDGYIETSKGIRIPFDDCRKYWQIIKAWHDGKEFTHHISMAGYEVQSFRNDILTAGCHRIAFCEMERMYKELCERTGEAA